MICLQQTEIYEMHYQWLKEIKVWIENTDNLRGPEVFVRLASRWNSLMMMMITPSLLYWKYKNCEN